MAVRVYLAVVVTAVALAGTGLAGPDTVAVADLVEAFDRAAGSQDRTAVYVAMSMAIRRGELVIGEGEADDLVRIMIRMLADADSPAEVYQALQIMAVHAHPDMVAPVLAALADESLADSQARARAVEVLVRCRDSRAVDLILPDLAGGNRFQVDRGIRLLAELGDARGLEPIQTLIADPGLADRYAEYYERYQRRSREQALESGRANAAETRAVAELALRQIRLAANQGVSCGFPLGASAMDTLSARGFVILPHARNEMYVLYDQEYPFVTTDVAFHTAIILVRASCDLLETSVLGEVTGRFCLGMAQASLAQAETASPADADLCRMNANFFTVSAVLCGAATPDSIALDETGRRLLAIELARIRDAASVMPSPLLGMTEDYTEYRPRGRFSRPGADVGYFQAVTWLGRGEFPAHSPSATRRALLMVSAMVADTSVFRAWETLDEVRTFLGGEPDDLTAGDIVQLAQEVSGLRGPDALASVLAVDADARRFREALVSRPGPRIQSGMDPALPRPVGFRVLGLRYTRDAHLFQDLLDDGVWPPSGLHVLAGLAGSDRAEEHLGGSTVHRHPPVGSFGPSLLEGWLECYAPVLAERGLPAPFAGRAWQDKQLNSALGAWAEARHATAAYTKEAHQYLGMSGMGDRVHGWVEPYPEFFRTLAKRLGELQRMLLRLDAFAAEDRAGQRIVEQLAKDHDVRSPGNSRAMRDLEEHEREYEQALVGIRLETDQIPRYQDVLARLAEIAAKCREGRPQDASDGIFLKALGGTLQHLSFNRSSVVAAVEPMSRAIDVATEYAAGEVLEAAVGLALPIYVAVPDGDRRIVCRGAVYSYYEFTRPLTERLDDETWTALAWDIGRPGGGPWLERACGLVHRDCLDRADLLAMDPREGAGGNEPWNSRAPWVEVVYDHESPPPLAGACARPDDTDVLLDLVRQRDASIAVVVFAARELERLAAGDPGVRRYFRGVVDAELAREVQGRWDRLPKLSDAVRLYRAIGVLAGSGEAEDRLRLALLRERVGLWGEIGGSWPQIARRYAVALDDVLGATTAASD